MSDRIAILNHGKLIQHGAPLDLYERPRTRFVADFLGKSNFLQGIARLPTAQGFTLEAGGQNLAVRLPAGEAAPTEGSRCLLSLRPEKISLLADGTTADNAVDGRILSWAYLGSGYSLRVGTEALGELRVVLPAWQAAIAPAEGLAIRMGWSADAAVPIEDDAA